MRKTRQETALTRDRIVRTSARLFRERGIDGIGVSELMSAADMTQGGFYRHFESKAELVAVACSVALEETRAQLSASAQKADAKAAVSALVDAYLSTVHRDSPGQGCPISTLAPEIARGGHLPAKALDQGIAQLLALINEHIKRSGQSDPSKTSGVLAALVGGLVLSRAIQDPESSLNFLNNTREFILNAVRA